MENTMDTFKAKQSSALAVLKKLQEFLELGSEARFNTPGTTAGNWCWRLPPDLLDAGLAQWYARLNQVFGRA